MQLTTPTATAKGPATTFTGDVFVNQLKGADEPSRLIAAVVRFMPGARSNWHSHALGQTLVGTDGRGLVVSRDGTVIRLNPGQVVWTPPGEEHWHGAEAECMMAHIAMLEGVADGDGTDWLEPVTDEQYEEAHRA